MNIGRRGFLGGAVATGAAALTGCATCGTCCGSAAHGKVKFKLGMAGWTMCKRKLDEALDIMEKADFHYLCVKDYHLSFEATDAEIAAFKEKCAKKGVVPYSLGPDYMSSRERADKVFAFAQRYGAKMILGVPYEVAPGKKDVWGPDRHESRKLCEYISTLCARYDIRYAIHNHGPDLPNLFPTGESVWEMVKDLDPRMGLCLDIGHDFRAGKDPVESVRKYASRIWDIHLKNVSEPTVKGKARLLPHGAMDLKAVLRALVDVGYDGVCSLEYETDYEDNLAAVAECGGYFRGLVDSL